MLVWRPGLKRDGDCQLLDLEGVADVFRLRYGVSRAADWPEDACCRFDPDYPKDILISDSPGGAALILASARLKHALLDKRVRDTEFLPLTLVNHKGRVASRDYFIVHPIRICDCIDLHQSGAEWNLIDKSVLTACKRLVLKPEAIPEDLALFRPRYWPKLALLRRSVAEGLLGEGFTGLHFIDLDNYTGLV